MKTVIILSFLLMLFSTQFAYGSDIDLDKPIPPLAKQLVESADKLAEKDQLQLAQANLKKAISIAPNYMYAHAKYVRFEEEYLNRNDDVIAEYQTLMQKEPGNPIYPMALAAGFLRVSEVDRKKWSAEVVRLAPNWVWAHYARVMTLIDDDNPAEDDKTTPEKLNELKLFLAGDGASWWNAVYIFEYYEKKQSGGIDDAILSAWERLNALPVSRPDDLEHLWQLRLEKEKRSLDSVNTLKTTLNNVLATSHDLKILVAAYRAYGSFLKSPDDAAIAKKAILKIDPTWYPDRGQVVFFGSSNITGFPHSFNAANHQRENFEKIKEIVTSGFSGKISTDEEILELKELEASRSLSPQLKRYIYERVFSAATTAKDVDALVRYGKLLLAADPTDFAVPTVIATALVNKVPPLDALRYATAAERATARFEIVSRPANNGVPDDAWKMAVTDQWQRQRYDKLRSRALDALGYANFRLGNLDNAEVNLNESITLSESETNLGHLSEVYEKAGKKDQAETYRKRSDEFYRSDLKKSLKSEKVKKDFEFKTVDGKTVKLSDLKGKVVLVDLWATWCSGCIVSIPHLKKLYEGLKDKGFEILFVSIDSEDDKEKVPVVAKEKSIPFPVVFDNGFHEAYNINEYPTSFFIDPKGNVRGRHRGFDPIDTPKEIETMFDLLKNEETGPDSAK